MADVLTINASVINLASTNTSLDYVSTFTKGGIPELHFTRLLGPLAALPDPWSGKPCSLTMLSGTSVFSGDVVGYIDRWVDPFGWAREYRALGLAQRANYIPLTDSETLTDTSVWDLPGDDPNFIGSRAGLTTGQIVANLLTMAVNGAPLNAAGIGAYTSTGPYVLPSATVSDLAALTILPPYRVSIQGERILQSLEDFIRGAHPNHFMHVLPDGTIRVYDSRSFTNNTLTLGSDPRLAMPELTRDYSDSYSQVEYRGNTLVRGVTLQTLPWPGSSSSDGGLQEDFAWGSLSNAAAKAAWVPANWSQPNQYGAPYDTGSCTCPSTTTIVVTSANTAMTWASNALSQANGLGSVTLYADVITGIDQIFQARVVSNTALTAGGTSTLTLDTPMPALTYNAYQLFALAIGPNIVGRKYKVTNAAIAAAMLNYFPYPVAYTNYLGTAADLTSTPIGTVMWGAFGGTSPPYNTGLDGVTIDPVNGFVYLAKPAQVVVNGLNTPVQFPANVQVFLPVATGTLTAYAPSSTTYSGTLYSVEGISRRKTITCLEWLDYGNQANMNTLASETLDSYKDVVVEGTLPYLGLMPIAYFQPGQAVSIAGTSGSTPYTTGWESLALPVVSHEIRFQPGASGTSYVTTLHLSNRRGRYSAGNYLRPNITGQQLGGGSEAFGGGSAYSAIGYQGPTQTGTLAGNQSNQLTQAGGQANQLTQSGGGITQAGNAANQLTQAGGGLNQDDAEAALRGGIG
jgi:hypothetical protein